MVGCPELNDFQESYLWAACGFPTAPILDRSICASVRLLTLTGMISSVSRWSIEWGGRPAGRLHRSGPPRPAALRDVARSRRRGRLQSLARTDLARTPSVP